MSGFDGAATVSQSVADQSVDRSALGRSVAGRLRRPGRPAHLRTTSTLGLVGQSAARFAAGTARPVAVRRALAASATVPARSVAQSAEVRPPRWWTPTASPDTDGSALAAELPTRGLARAARQVPTDNQQRSPGTIAGGLVSTP